MLAIQPTRVRPIGVQVDTGEVVPVRLSTGQLLVHGCLARWGERAAENERRSDRNDDGERQRSIAPEDVGPAPRFREMNLRREIQVDDRRIVDVVSARGDLERICSVPPPIARHAEETIRPNAAHFLPVLWFLAVRPPIMATLAGVAQW